MRELSLLDPSILAAWLRRRVTREWRRPAPGREWGDLAARLPAGIPHAEYAFWRLHAHLLAAGAARDGRLVEEVIRGARAAATTSPGPGDDGLRLFALLAEAHGIRAAIQRDRDGGRLGGVETERLERLESELLDRLQRIAAEGRVFEYELGLRALGRVRAALAPLPAYLALPLRLRAWLRPSSPEGRRRLQVAVALAVAAALVGPALAALGLWPPRPKATGSSSEQPVFARHDAGDRDRADRVSEPHALAVPPPPDSSAVDPSPSPAPAPDPAPVTKETEGDRNSPRVSTPDERPDVASLLERGLKRLARDCSAGRSDACDGLDVLLTAIQIVPGSGKSASAEAWREVCRDSLKLCRRAIPRTIRTFRVHAGNEGYRNNVLDLARQFGILE